MVWKKGTSWGRWRSSPACLEWQSKLSKKRGFTPSVFPRAFLQHSQFLQHNPSSQWAFRFQVEDAFGFSHVTNTSTTSDLVDTVRSVAIEAHIYSGPSGGLFIYG